MIPDKFTVLVQEFNETAGKFRTNDNITTNLLLAKYTALLNFKTETDADKTTLARSLLDCGLNVLKAAAAGPTSGKTYTPGEVNYPAAAKADAVAILQRLAAPDSIDAVPQGAPEELADAALALLRKGETLRWDQFGTGDRTNYGHALTALAETALSFAEQFQAARRGPEVTTSQNISPSKRITFKGPEATP